MKQNYFVEYTDTFGGEPNYSFVRRYKVRASTSMGAARKVATSLGIRVRHADTYDDVSRYDSMSKQTCMFVSEWDDNEHYPDYAKEI